jgi:hypothetical protein
MARNCPHTTHGKGVTMQTDYKFRQIVGEFTDQAKAVAFDGCHKIYIALDMNEAAWYHTHGYDTYVGEPEQMLEWVCARYEESCGLEYIDATSWDIERGGSDFIRVIPQGAGPEGGWTMEEE